MKAAPISAKVTLRSGLLGAEEDCRGRCLLVFGTAGAEEPLRKARALLHGLDAHPLVTETDTLLAAATLRHQTCSQTN